MDWTQTLTLGAYITGICAFFYHLNEKSIDKLDKRMTESDQHWRDMFMYMNNKIDERKKPS